MLLKENFVGTSFFGTLNFGTFLSIGVKCIDAWWTRVRFQSFSADPRTTTAPKRARTSRIDRKWTVHSNKIDDLKVAEI